MLKLFSRKAIVLLVAFFAYFVAISAGASHIHISDALSGHSPESCIICHVSQLTFLKPIIQAVLPCIESIGLFKHVQRPEPACGCIIRNTLARAPPGWALNLPRRH
jgi:hypothetical protein